MLEETRNSRQEKSPWPELALASAPSGPRPEQMSEDREALTEQGCWVCTAFPKAGAAPGGTAAASGEPGCDLLVSLWGESLESERLPERANKQNTRNGKS